MKQAINLPVGAIWDNADAPNSFTGVFFVLPSNSHASASSNFIIKLKNSDFQILSKLGETKRLFSFSSSSQFANIFEVKSK